MDMEKIQSFVGPITEKQIECIDSFVGERLALFVPAVGQCGYALTKEHTHPAYSFVLTFDDNLSVAGATGSIRNINRGTLIGMSPDFKHHEEQQEDFPRYYAIMINTNFYNEILQDYGISANPQYHFSMNQMKQELLPHLREFMVESQKSSAAAKAKIAALEILITHSIAESQHGTTEEENPSIHNRVEIDRAVEYMHRTFGEKLTVDTIAKEVCLSPSHLSHLFKESVGKTVMGYLTEIRLQTAKRLLLLKRESISEIAFTCGFSSPSHLSQSFKNHYGITPREVQKSA